MYIHEIIKSIKTTQMIGMIQQCMSQYYGISENYLVRAFVNY